MILLPRALTVVTAVVAYAGVGNIVSEALIPTDVIAPNRAVIHAVSADHIIACGVAASVADVTAGRVSSGVAVVAAYRSGRITAGVSNCRIQNPTAVIDPTEPKRG